MSPRPHAPRVRCFVVGSRIDERVLPRELQGALERVNEAFVCSQSFLESFQLLGFGEADETARRTPSHLSWLSRAGL